MMPDSVKVGTHTFEILLRDSKDDGGLDDAFGYTTDASSLIVMRKDMPLAKAQQTLLHEIFHAIRFIYGSHTVPAKNASIDDLEHHFISLYEQPLLAIFRDNPDLYDYLMEGQ